MADGIKMRSDSELLSARLLLCDQLDEFESQVRRGRGTRKVREMLTGIHTMGKTIDWALGIDNENSRSFGRVLREIERNFGKGK